MDTPKSYAAADAFLVTRGKAVPRKKCGNNTTLERLEDGAIGLRFHDTVVVTYRPNAQGTTTLTLHTGGFLTGSTKDRINSALTWPVVVLSEHGTWQVSLDGWHTEQRYRFTEGITLMDMGEGWAVDTSTLQPTAAQEADDRHNAAMRALVKRYLKDVPTPTLTAADGGAPCSLCLAAKDTYRPDAYRGTTQWSSIGDVMGDTQHLVDHMIDGLLPQGLETHALTEAGYQTHVSHSIDTVKRSLRAYLLRRLLVGATTTQHGRRPVLPTGVPA